MGIAKTLGFIAERFPSSHLTGNVMSIFPPLHMIVTQNLNYFSAIE
jgi:hypothetical protein